MSFCLAGLSACADDALTNPPPKAETIQAFKAEPAVNNGDVNRGARIFGRLPCLTCHTLGGSPVTNVPAPALDKIGTNAATRLPGVNAAQYLRHAVIKPEDLKLHDYNNIMPGFGATLQPGELEDLVAFLLSLK
jgi:mono/diheme cytochrome c family protein